MRAEEYEYLDAIYEQCKEIEYKQDMSPRERAIETICSIVGGILMFGIILCFVR